MSNNQFTTRVCEGMIHNYAQGLSRLARWVDARDIPLQYLQGRYGLPGDNALHPHNIEGLAWDVDRKEWRNAKNARDHDIRLDLVEWDETAGSLSLVTVLVP